MRGRPTKYRKEFIKTVEKYYKNCINKAQMPYIEDIAILLEVDDDTINEWCKAKPDFSATIWRIKLLQRKSLKKLAIRSPQGAIFLLKANHGLVEKQHLIHEGEEEHVNRYTLGEFSVPIPLETKQS